MISYRVNISTNKRLSKVQQIVAAFVKDIESGKLKNEQQLPSINRFSEENAVGRDTIEKAYKHLRRRGYVASLQGRGYFVVGQDKKQPRVLLIFNKLSSFKKIIYDSLIDSLKGKAKVDLQIHHYDPKLLREILEANLGRYDCYAIMPHFFSHAKPRDYLPVLKMVPTHELILLDKNVPELKATVKAVYQDFESDIYEALQLASPRLLAYKSLNLILPDDSHHPKGIIAGVAAFCAEQKMGFKKTGNVGDEALQKRAVYLVTEDDNLARLIKKVRQADLIPGKDIGIVSFNETVFKELLDITVMTTDFEEMGRTAAKLILNREFIQVRNPFRVIERQSL
jgi:DNA-binding transcriptional regulator YhcF (GntR family)